MNERYQATKGMMILAGRLLLERPEAGRQILEKEEEMIGGKTEVKRTPMRNGDGHAKQGEAFSKGNRKRKNA